MNSYRGKTVRMVRAEQHMIDAGLLALKISIFTNEPRKVLAIQQVTSEPDFPAPLVSRMLRELADALDHG